MSLNAIQFLGPNPVADRVALWVRDYSAKELAAMFGASERTARGWRDGNMPQNIHLIAMAQRWGMNFLEDVFAPVIGLDISDAQRLERIERDVKALRDKGAKTKAVVSIALVLLSTFGAILDGDPVVRAPRPVQSRARREIA